MDPLIFTKGLIRILQYLCIVLTVSSLGKLIGCHIWQIKI